MALVIAGVLCGGQEWAAASDAPGYDAAAPTDVQAPPLKPSNYPSIAAPNAGDAIRQNAWRLYNQQLPDDVKAQAKLSPIAKRPLNGQAGVVAPNSSGSSAPTTAAVIAVPPVDALSVPVQPVVPAASNNAAAKPIVAIDDKDKAVPVAASIDAPIGNAANAVKADAGVLPAVVAPVPAMDAAPAAVTPAVESAAGVLSAPTTASVPSNAAQLDAIEKALPPVGSQTRGMAPVVVPVPAAMAAEKPVVTNAVASAVQTQPQAPQVMMQAAPQIVAAPKPMLSVTPAVAKAPAPVAMPSVAPSISFDKNSPKDMFADSQDAVFLRNLAGTDGISLNVTDVVSPADVQTPIHLDEAVAFALKNNFEVQAANEKSRGAYWDKMGGYSEYLPSIELSADTGPEKSDPAAFNDAQGNRVLDSTHNRKDSSVSIRQPLIDLSVISDILSGKDKQEVADTDRLDVREGIAYDTTSTYLGLVQSRIAVRLADEYKSYLDNLAVRMQARVEGGGGTNADLDRIRGRASSAESARIEALGEYATNLADFKRLTKITPAQLIIPDVLAPPIPEVEQDALERALKSNPAYVSSLKKIDVAVDDRNKSFSGLLPRLSAEYTNSYAFNAGGSAEGNPVDGVYPTQRTEALLLVAQWSLNGGTAVAGGMSGAAKEREMNLRALDVRARLEQGIRAGYAAINAAHQRQVVLKKTVDSNLRVVKGFEDQYTNGTRSLFDLLDAYEQLYSSRLNLMRVTMANAKATYQIHRQMGVLIPSIIKSEDK